jgi:hypothetical protein
MYLAFAFPKVPDLQSVSLKLLYRLQSHCRSMLGKVFPVDDILAFSIF